MLRNTGVINSNEDVFSNGKVNQRDIIIMFITWLFLPRKMPRNIAKLIIVKMTKNTINENCHFMYSVYEVIGT